MNEVGSTRSLKSHKMKVSDEHCAYQKNLGTPSPSSVSISK